MFKAQLHDLMHAAHITDVGELHFDGLRETDDGLEIFIIEFDNPPLEFADQEVEVGDFGDVTATDTFGKEHRIRFSMLRAITESDLDN